MFYLDGKLIDKFSGANIEKLKEKVKEKNLSLNLRKLWLYA
jgi:hypothetical protein